MSRSSCRATLMAMATPRAKDADLGLIAPGAIDGIRVGIGGWTYAPWRETFFPEGLVQRRELEYASRRLSAIEINGTYYSAQKPRHLRQMARRDAGRLRVHRKGADAHRAVEACWRTPAGRSKPSSAASRPWARSSARSPGNSNASWIAEDFARSSMRCRQPRRPPRCGMRWKCAMPRRSTQRSWTWRAGKRGAGVHRFDRMALVRRCHRGFRLCAIDARALQPRHRLHAAGAHRLGRARAVWAKGGDPADLPRFKAPRRRRSPATCSSSSSTRTRNATPPRRPP